MLTGKIDIMLKFNENCCQIWPFTSFLFSRVLRCVVEGRMENPWKTAHEG